MADLAALRAHALANPWLTGGGVAPQPEMYDDRWQVALSLNR